MAGGALGARVPVGARHLWGGAALRPLGTPLILGGLRGPDAVRSPRTHSGPSPGFLALLRSGAEELSGFCCERRVWGAALPKPPGTAPKQQVPAETGVNATPAQHPTALPPRSLLCPSQEPFISALHAVPTARPLSPGTQPHQGQLLSHSTATPASQITPSSALLCVGPCSNPEHQIPVVFIARQCTRCWQPPAAPLVPPCSHPHAPATRAPPAPVTAAAAARGPWN